MCQIQVKVHNPIGRNGYTSLKSAKRYIERGRARWRPDGSVEFIADDGDYRAVAVITSTRLSERSYDHEVANGAIASLDAIKHLPVAGDPSKLLTTMTRKQPISWRRIKLRSRIVVRDGSQLVKA